MALGQFTKEEAAVVIECVEALYTAIPKSRRGEYIGELNEALCFIEAAKTAAPHEGAEGDSAGRLT